jgi:hypothetical protein
MKHQDSYDRERHAKRMENPQQAFEEDKRRAESVRAERAAKSKPTPETDKDREGEGRYSELQRSSAKRKFDPRCHGLCGSQKYTSILVANVKRR